MIERMKSRPMTEPPGTRGSAKIAAMGEPLKSRLLVCARGIEVWVRKLSERADLGDIEAEQALDRLRGAFEAARKALGEGPEMQADEFVAVYDGLLILEQAVEGRSEYPLEVLRAIARQAARDCKRLGLRRFDEEKVLEFFEGDL